jgi:hypothetical protein
MEKVFLTANGVMMAEDVSGRELEGTEITGGKI